jgi:L-ascorbate metabolism protein UlaG (beta-lactamase superfamily)
VWERQKDVGIENMSIALNTYLISPLFFAQQEATTLTWLGMAGALVNARGIILLIDPLLVTIEKDGRQFSEVGYPLKVPPPIQAVDFPKADLVMYTHADDDHFGPQTAKTLAERTQCRFLAPVPVCQRLNELGIGQDRLITAVDFAVHQQNEIEVLVTPALHDWQEVNPWKRGDCCGYVIKSQDGTIWHPGDTRLIDELLNVKDIDVLFFDVAAVESHLGPEGSARLGASCGAKILIAYHYGTFDLPPGSFASCDPDDAWPYLQGMAAKYLKLQPGESYSTACG